MVLLKEEKRLAQLIAEREDEEETDDKRLGASKIELGAKILSREKISERLRYATRRRCSSSHVTGGAGGDWTPGRVIPISGYSYASRV